MCQEECCSRPTSSHEGLTFPRASLLRADRSITERETRHIGVLPCHRGRRVAQSGRVPPQPNGHTAPPIDPDHPTVPSPKSPTPGVSSTPRDRPPRDQSPAETGRPKKAELTTTPLIQDHQTKPDRPGQFTAATQEHQTEANRSGALTAAPPLLRSTAPGPTDPDKLTATTRPRGAPNRSGPRRRPHCGTRLPRAPNRGRPIRSAPLLSSTEPRPTDPDKLAAASANTDQGRPTRTNSRRPSRLPGAANRGRPRRPASAPTRPGAWSRGLSILALSGPPLLRKH
jgi:hypothetical protein